MCIIVAVPQDAEMPSIDTLKECFRYNPDGAGFMYADGKSVRIRKGFMTFDDFIEALDEESIPDNSALVMHFRIATHGKVKPACCHPFPVSDKQDDLKALSVDARWGVAHNGVIQGRSTNESWSDTMDFVHKVIVPLSKMNPNFIHSDDALDMLEGACKSKLAILDNAGDLALVGNFIEDKGVFYSNTTYLPVRYNWSSYSNWWSKSTYDDYDYGKSYSTSQYDDVYAEWDDIDDLIAALPWIACEVCPMAEDCARYGDDYGFECETELDALQVCADFSGETLIDLAESLGISFDELAIKA